MAGRRYLRISEIDTKTIFVGFERKDMINWAEVERRQSLVISH